LEYIPHNQCRVGENLRGGTFVVLLQNIAAVTSISYMFTIKEV